MLFRRHSKYSLRVRIHVCCRACWYHCQYVYVPASTVIIQRLAQRAIVPFCASIHIGLPPEGSSLALEDMLTIAQRQLLSRVAKRRMKNWDM